jgi:hypothetical protein
LLGSTTSSFSCGELGKKKKQWRTAVPDATEAKLALFYSKGDSTKIATASKQEKFMEEGPNNKHIKG